MSDDLESTTANHPSGHRQVQPANKPPSPATDGPISTTWPADADLAYDEVRYGPDIVTETDLRLLGDVEGKRVLDLGCGSGHAAVALARRGAHVIAVDPSSDRLLRSRDAAEEQEVRVEFHQSDLAELAFVRADSIDVVFSAYALATVPNLDRVFRQVHRVLRPELHLVFSLPHPAFALVDPASNDPLRIRRRYWDEGPRGESTTAPADFPRSLSAVFTGLGRANFRVDTLLEPEPLTDEPRSAYWTEAMRWVPATLIVRARKEGI